jgi:hypothetical protein
MILSFYFFLLWILLAIIPAAIASRKGRSGVGWFFISWLISPLFAGIIVACLKPLKENIEMQALSQGMRKCPFCAELVKAEAKVCRYCQRDLPDLPPITEVPDYLSNFRRMTDAEKIMVWQEMTELQRNDLVSKIGPEAAQFFQAHAKSHK